MKQYLKNTYDALFTVLVGMKITFSHLFKPNVTIQYPEVKPVIPERARNRLFVNMDDCIGCEMCSKSCPVNCISIESVRATPDDAPGITSNGKKKALWVSKFEIDIAKCCFCSLCVYPCPTECIQMTKVYEFSEFDRNDLVYNFATLTNNQIKEKRNKFEQFQAEKEAAKVAAAKAKAAKAKAAKEAAAKEASNKKSEDKPESKSE